MERRPVASVPWTTSPDAKASGLPSGASHERTGQIGICGKADDNSASCWCSLTRSGRMVRHQLASHQPRRSPTPSAYRAGNEGKQMGQGASLATPADLLTHSYSGKVLAVRRVTENNGKKTPGVDKEIWDTPKKKIQAVHALKRRGYQPQPLRRVYMKSDGKTMRPLGIPTMKDRAQQALHLLALDPVVETTADNNSYGFRQQRSCA